MGQPNRNLLISFATIFGLGVTSVGSAATPELSAERCNAAEALIRYLASVGITGLGEPASNLRSAPEEPILMQWPGGLPPREILVGLNEEHPKSVLACSGVKRLANNRGLALARNEALPSGAAVYSYVSLPTLSSDGKSAASVVVNRLSSGHGSKHVVTLSKQSGEWKVGDSFIVSFS